MAKPQLKPVLIMSFDRAKGDSATAVPEILKADPQAIIVVASGTAAVSFIKEMRARGSTAQFLTLSNNSSSAFVKDLGSDGRGVLMTQVSPAADSARTLLGNEFLKIAMSAGATPSYAAMEAWCATKVLVEGLRRAGHDLMCKRFVAALNAMTKYDLGGMTVDYSPTRHTDSTFVEMTMIGANGNFIR